MAFLYINMKVAILIDGSFFLKRAQSAIPNFEPDPDKTANLIVSYAMRHVEHYKDDSKDDDTLYRIFYYDCPPITKKAHYPISKKAIDFSKTEQSVFRLSLYQKLRSKRKLALRLGYLSDKGSWKIKSNILQDLIKGRKTWNSLGDSDFCYDVRQKAVDSRIAVDIASLAFKSQVDRIILIAGDADFVPASKLARREGIDFILDPLHNHISEDLHEHIDGCHSKGLKPTKGRTSQCT